MKFPNFQAIQDLYDGFNAPITHIDCGQKCGVYNEDHAPFCCDVCHVIPTAYAQEWDYFKSHTDLWHKYHANCHANTDGLKEKLPEDQLMIECLGHRKCQRDFRAISCRAFPFFPYIDQKGIFIGLAYYWEYEDRCWVINHLHMVTPEFRDEFVTTFDTLLSISNQEYLNFRHQSIVMRRVFGRKKRAILLISRNKTPDINIYKISPRHGRMRKIDPTTLTKQGYYFFSDNLLFPEEIPEK